MHPNRAIKGYRFSAVSVKKLTLPASDTTITK